jgi:hypothetical protein
MASNDTPAALARRRVPTPCATTRIGEFGRTLEWLKAKQFSMWDELAFCPSMTPVTDAPLDHPQLLCPTLSVIHFVDGT